MKIGDKVYCIKTNISRIQIIAGTELNVKGHIYTIDGIEHTAIKTSCELPYSICVYTLTESDYMFNKYFITLKQLRKEKLKKINDSNL